ncbi:MAG TPA: hypothetical protein VKF32_07225, partial [Thermoanaerobaculia bacterium]|nr:hypothetical protein [Thermoanaerobaculia bacterium]
AAAPAAIPVGSVDGGTWHVHSPYAALGKARQLLDTIGFEVLSSYAAATAPPRAGGLADRPGSLIARVFTKKSDGGTRTVELVVAAHAAGGFELYVTGSAVGGGHEDPNPDLPEIEAGIQKLIGNVAATSAQVEGAAIDKRRLAYEVFQLSYVEPDRAIALLKALDYTTIEFNDSPGETLYDKIFALNILDKDKARLPLVIKMISASKTSLQENTAETPSYGLRGNELLPDLGGIFLHRTTAAEPQNRLLIAYDQDDPASLERVVNLLRDKVDVAARQIMLEALVIEINSDLTKDLGVSFQGSGTVKGTTTNTYDGSINKDALLSGAPLAFLFSRSSDVLSFKAALNALLEDDRARILSNPSVLVLDGRQAKIQIGQRIPVVETTVTQSTATESILYFPVGIVLNLRPRLNQDGSEVSMQVETIVSSVRTTSTNGVSVTKAPEVDSRQVQTLVRVQNDTPFIIGGLTSNEETKNVRGVPLLSKIPFLGALFRRETTERTKKEIIIVVTPHLVPEDTKAFSYVLPQESAEFDTFGRQLLYNAYRIRQGDVFSLGFLRQSDAYRGLEKCARRHADEGKTDPALARVLEGGIPGEEILVRRMLWEIIRKTDYARFVDTEKLIFFEEAPLGAGGFTLSFLSKELAKRDKKSNALLLVYEPGTGTLDHPFSQPTAKVSFESLESKDFFGRLDKDNARTADAERWTVLVTDEFSGTARPLDVLKGVMVLRRLLALNPNLRLSIDGFRAGRQIVFPTESEMRQSYHLIDAEAARLFYEITSYYPAFEKEFKRQARVLVERMGGCEWWTRP